MPTISSILSLAKRSLLANQGAMSVASDNVSNVNSPGYARRRADLRSAQTQDTPYGGLGSGVELFGVNSLRDPFIEEQLRRELGDEGWFDTGQKQLDIIEGLLGEIGETGMSNIFSRFWNAWHDLANDPTSTAARTALRETTSTLIGGFRNTGEQLAFRAEQIDADIAAKASRVNELAGELAQLNHEFSRARETPMSLEDRRTQILDEMARLADIQYRIGNNGMVSVFIDGAAIVMGTDCQTIAVREGSGGKAALFIAEASDRPLGISGGEIGALFSVRDGELNELRERLDELARTLATEVNRIHSTGYSLEGQTGINFFDPETTGMDDIALSDEIERDAGLIAASADGLPGDNRTALAIAELENANLMNGGRETIDQAYGSITAWFGSRVAEHGLRAEGAGLALEHMETWRESVSGVSLDEEMAQLIRFQHAFNASAKLVGAADTMLQAIIAMAG